MERKSFHFPNLPRGERLYPTLPANKIYCTDIRNRVSSCMKASEIARQKQEKYLCPLPFRWSNEISKKCTSTIDSEKFGGAKNTLDLKDIDRMILTFSTAIFKAQALRATLLEEKKWYRLPRTKNRMQTKYEALGNFLQQMKEDKNPIHAYQINNLKLSSGDNLTVRDSIALPEKIRELRDLIAKPPSDFRPYYMI